MKDFKSISDNELIKVFEKYNSISKMSIELFGYNNRYTNNFIKSKIQLLGYTDLLLTNKQRYEKTPKLCLNCKDIIPYTKRSNKYCNSSCSAKHTNVGKIHSDSTKTKIRKTLLNHNNLILKDKINQKTIIIEDNQVKRKYFCNSCNNEFYHLKYKKYCCNECKRKEVSKKQSEIKLLAVKNGTHKGWQNRKIRSYAELFFEKVLNNNFIHFIAEYKINKRDLGFDNSSNYFLDFYLPDYNIDLEIDGKQHEYPDRIKSDKIRDEFIIKYGILVYRIKWKNPYKNEEYIKNEIDKLLLFLSELK